MEVFSLLKFWRVTAGDDVAGGGYSDTDIAISSSLGLPAVDSDEEDSFFDLKFTTPNSEKDSTFVESPTDVFFEVRVSLPLEEPNSKAQSLMTSFLRSPPKFRVFMLFKKLKMMEKTEPVATGVSPPATMKHRPQSKRFAVKCKVEEVPIFSLLSRVNSSRSNSQKQRFGSDAAPAKHFAKDLVEKYMKLIKPLYIRPSKRYSEKMKFVDEL